MALEFAVIVFLGIFIVRIRLVGPDFRAALAKFVTNVALPCMIARSLYAQTDRFAGVGRVMLLAVLAVLLLLAGGQVIYLLAGKGDLAKSARFSLAFGNFTFMGFPVVESLYGADGLFVFTLFTLPIRLFFYSTPGFLLQPTGEKAKRPDGRRSASSFSRPPSWRCSWASCSMPSASARPCSWTRPFRPWAAPPAFWACCWWAWAWRA